jgi:hypothetical protein
MSSVPKGRWFCTTCQNQKRKLFSPLKAQAKFLWEADEDTENIPAQPVSKKRKKCSQKSPALNDFVLQSISNLGKSVASFVKPTSVSGTDSASFRVKSEIAELF